MVWSSINTKLRHLIKIFMSYVSLEIKLSKAVEIMLLISILSFTLILNLFI